MDNRYFTVQELQTLKFYELPNTIYSHILSDLVHLFGVMTERMLNAFNNTSVEQEEQTFSYRKLQGRTLIRDFSMLFYNAHEEYRFYQRKQKNIRLCLNPKGKKENYHDNKN